MPHDRMYRIEPPATSDTDRQWVNLLWVRHVRVRGSEPVVEVHVDMGTDIVLVFPHATQTQARADAQAWADRVNDVK